MRQILALKSPTASYAVGAQIGGTDKFSLYRCRKDGETRQRILKIATVPEHNGLLDREAYLLRYLDEEAVRVEAEYEKEKRGKSMLNYNLSFPHVDESFVALEHDGRRISILSFHGVDDISKLVPIGHVSARDKVRVDPRTGAWMMGKLLKILTFAHNRGIGVKQVTGDNVLIERDQHYVIIFDWSMAQRHKAGIPRDAAVDDIAHAARELVLVLGGNPQSGELPSSDQLTDGQYAEFLHSLALGRESSASTAHTGFYSLIRGRWPREFYAYTTHPRT